MKNLSTELEKILFEKKSKAKERVSFGYEDTLKVKSFNEKTGLIKFEINRKVSFTPESYFVISVSYKGEAKITKEEYENMESIADELTHRSFSLISYIISNTMLTYKLDPFITPPMGVELKIIK